MRKLIFAIPLLFMVSMFAGCSGSGEQGSSNDTIDSLDLKIASVVDRAEADTLAQLLGKLCGNDLSCKIRLAQGNPSFKTFENEDYMRGLRVALTDENHSVSYTEGVRSALEILNKIEDFKKYGVDINREMLLNALERQLFADSISGEKMTQFNSEYNVLLQRAYAAEKQ